jgi:hypothetical protein
MIAHKKKYARCSDHYGQVPMRSGSVNRHKGEYHCTDSQTKASIST